MQLIFRLRHIIKQKFKNQRTSKPASFNLKIRKSHGHVNILYIIHNMLCTDISIEHKNIYVNQHS